MAYFRRWECGDCGTNNSKELTRYEAAFLDSLDLRFECVSCGSTKYQTSSFTQPKIDADLLEAWFKDSSLMFMQQDEDLLVADADLAEIRAFLDRPDAPEARRAKLGEALAVKLYDGAFKNEAERRWILDWLRAYPEAWRPFAWDYIVEYVDEILKASD